MFTKLFTTAAVLAVAQTALASCNRKYTVQEGDICDSISAENNVSTYQLAAVNYGIIDEYCGNLQPGAEYCLGYGDEDCTTTYVVKSGDTCPDIASAHAINSTMIHLNNPQVEDDCSNIYVGEVLCVADTVIVPPAPPTMPATKIPATAVAASEPAPTPEPEVEEEEEEETYEYEESYDDDEDIPYCDEI